MVHGWCIGGCITELRGPSPSYLTLVGQRPSALGTMQGLLSSAHIIAVLVLYCNRTVSKSSCAHGWVRLMDKHFSSGWILKKCPLLRRGAFKPSDSLEPSPRLPQPGLRWLFYCAGAASLRKEPQGVGKNPMQTKMRFCCHKNRWRQRAMGVVTELLLTLVI